MGYQRMSVVEAVNEIDQGRIFLPEIQRNFVWKPEQIENLFDSIILGYPIGSLLFWKTTKSILNKDADFLNLYEFIRDYHERDNRENKPAPSVITSDFDSYYLVLDGQQRLSSFYIALKGTMSVRQKGKWWNRDESYPKKELYLNVQAPLSNLASDDEDVKRFKFLTSEEAKAEPQKWFRVKELLRFEDDDALMKYSNKAFDENEQASRSLNKLYKKLTDVDRSPINFFEIESQNYDDVLSIFVRLNSYGTPLSKTDLLFSTIVAGWPGGRDQIESLIQSMNHYDGGHFEFGNDFVMRAFLVLSDMPIALKVTSFKKSSIKAISNSWDQFRATLLSIASFLSRTGFSAETIQSYNALMPIAYYLYKGGKLNSNIEGMRKYFIIAQIKNVFGTASNTAINETRRILQGIDCKKTPFDVSLFETLSLTGGANFNVDQQTVDRCFDYDKGPYTFMLLSLLYPGVRLDKGSFHQDHCHPYVGFEPKRIKGLGIDRDTIDRWRSMRNKLPNLELLEGPENQSKNDKTLREWIEAGNKVDYLPDGVSLDLKDFDDFYSKRKELMEAKLKSILF